jgi:hypothetical protein
MEGSHRREQIHMVRPTDETSRGNTVSTGLTSGEIPSILTAVLEVFLRRWKLSTRQSSISGNRKFSCQVKNHWLEVCSFDVDYHR